MTEPNEEIIPLILSAAIASAGPKGNNEGQWLGKVNDAIPSIAAMMNEGSRQWHIATEVLGAAVFVATYVGHEIEESSTRALVRIDTGKATKNYPDGIEPIRTHRTDGAQGRHMKERLDRLEPGDEIVVWKALEANDDGTEKYRVLVHFQTRPKRTDSPSRGTAAPAAAPGRDDGEPVEPEPPTGSGPRPSTDKLTDSIDSEQLLKWRSGAREALTNDEFEELTSGLSLVGYNFDGVSEVEWVDIVRPAIRNIINQRGT